MEVIGFIVGTLLTGSISAVILRSKRETPRRKTVRRFTHSLYKSDQAKKSRIARQEKQQKREDAYEAWRIGNEERKKASQDNPAVVASQQTVTDFGSDHSRHDPDHGTSYGPGPGL